MFRCKTGWYHEGEKSTKYFFNLKKIKYLQKNMTCLIRTDGTISRNQKEIFRLQAEYYRKLYQTDINVEFVLENSSDFKLSDETKSDLERPISIEELGLLMTSMQKGKTPGCNGLPVEIYASLWDTTAVPLHNAILYAFNKGELHRSARRGIISLIPKKSREGLYIKNWCPLTLHNVDYKILAKAIAH